MKRYTLITVVLCFFIAGCDRYTATDTEQFSISQPFDVLVINSPAGLIDVQKGQEGATVEVTAQKEGRSWSTAAAQQIVDRITITSSVDNNTCTITVTLPDPSPDAFAYVNLTLVNVQNKRVIINAAAGDIHIDEMSGGIIDVAAGSVTIDNATDDIVVSDDAGSISVAYAAGDIDITGSAGDVTVGDFRGPAAKIELATGDIDLTINGSGRLDGSLVLAAGNIDINLSIERSCTAELETLLGDISISGIGPYDSSSEDLKNRVSFTLNDGAGTLTAKVEAGSIQVQGR